MNTIESIQALELDSSKLLANVIEISEDYRRASEILERTYIALGRKKTVEATSTSSNKSTIDVKAIGSTTKI